MAARAGRLRTPAEYAAVRASPRARTLRAARTWLAMTAAWTASAAPAVRFGWTVARREAPRAVDRSLVKRIVREACRQAAPALLEHSRARAWSVDVVFRLKAVRRRTETDAAWPARSWRRALRDEADSLLRQLGATLGASQATTPDD